MYTNKNYLELFVITQNKKFHNKNLLVKIYITPFIDNSK